MQPQCKLAAPHVRLSTDSSPSAPAGGHMESKSKIMSNDAASMSLSSGKRGSRMASLMGLFLTQQDDPITHQFAILSGRCWVLSALSHLIFTTALLNKGHKKIPIL